MRCLGKPGEHRKGPSTLVLVATFLAVVALALAAQWVASPGRSHVELKRHP